MEKKKKEETKIRALFSDPQKIQYKGRRKNGFSQEFRVHAFLYVYYTYIHIRIIFGIRYACQRVHGAAQYFPFGYAVVNSRDNYCGNRVIEMNERMLHVLRLILRL